MRRLEESIAGNARFLRQGLTLLRKLDAQRYAATPEHFARGGVGAHFRHVLDHYDCFLTGLSDGRIAYDRRERDRDTERNPRIAARRFERVLVGLRALSAEDADRSLQVALDRGEQSDGRHRWGISSVLRELQFLGSHTVHHYAVIAAMLRPQGVEPGIDFGVAPSTLEHEQGAACAR